MFYQNYSKLIKDQLGYQAVLSIDNKGNLSRNFPHSSKYSGYNFVSFDVESKEIRFKLNNNDSIFVINSEEENMKLITSEVGEVYNLCGYECESIILMENKLFFNTIIVLIYILMFSHIKNGIEIYQVVYLLFPPPPPLPQEEKN